MNTSTASPLNYIGFLCRYIFPAQWLYGLCRALLAIERGWLWMHESRTYVKFTQAGAELFA